MCVRVCEWTSERARGSSDSWVCVCVLCCVCVKPASLDFANDAVYGATSATICRKNRFAGCCLFGLPCVCVNTVCLCLWVIATFVKCSNLIYICRYLFSFRIFNDKLFYNSSLCLQSAKRNNFHRLNLKHTTRLTPPEHRHGHWDRARSAERQRRRSGQLFARRRQDADEETGPAR